MNLDPEPYHDAEENTMLNGILIRNLEKYTRAHRYNGIIKLGQGIALTFDKYRERDDNGKYTKIDYFDFCLENSGPRAYFWDNWFSEYINDSQDDFDLIDRVEVFDTIYDHADKYICGIYEYGRDLARAVILCCKPGERSIHLYSSDYLAACDFYKGIIAGRIKPIEYLEPEPRD